MSYGPYTVFTATMPSGGTSTSGVELARAWKYIYLEIPTMTSNTEMYVNGSGLDTTYRPIYHALPAITFPVAIRFVINSALTNAFVPVPNGIRYLKVETSATVDDGCIFRVVCSD